MRESRTYIAIPPGETIKEKLEDLNMTQKEFSMRMGLSEKHISRLINGDVQLTPEVAIRLESVLRIPAKFWNNLEAIYREELLKVEEENHIDSELEIAKKIPYAQMANLGWIPNTTKTMERVYILRHFFEVASLELLTDASLMPQAAFRKADVAGASFYKLFTWLQKVKLEARRIQTGKIDYLKIDKILPILRDMTNQSPSFFKDKLVDLLSECGIALVVLPHIKGSGVHGGSFIYDKKIALGITLRRKYADEFWHSLFHELGHIKYQHINNKNGTSASDEKMADLFAQDSLIPFNEYEQFVMQSNFSYEAIRNFANKIRIAPGIVVGRLQHDKYIAFSYGNELRIKYEFKDS